MTSTQADGRSLKLSRYTMLALGIGVLCVLPWVLITLGADFTMVNPVDLTPLSMAEDGQLPLYALYAMLRGSFLHTIIGWSITCVALMTGVYAFAHFRVKRDPLTPIICMAAFWAGSINGFYVLASHGVSFPVLNLVDLVALGSAVAESFSAAILIVAALVVLTRKQSDLPAFDLRAVLGLSLLFGAIAFGVTSWTATSEVLPAMYRAEQWPHFPWNLGALLLYVLAAGVVFPRLYRRDPNHFSFALWLSALPFAAGQIYLVFGSAVLFDSYFNASMALKLVGYLVIFGGLTWDYSHTCREESTLRRHLQLRDRRIRLLVDNANEAIVLFDAERRIRLWNPRARQIFGWSAQDAMGGDVVDLLLPERSHSAFLDCLSQLLEEAADGSATQPCEMAALAKEGGELFVEYSIIPAFEEGVPFFAMLARDVSEHKQLRLRMIQMDRAIAVGTLAAGVGHELNNPLSYVIANLYFAHEQISELLPKIEALTRLAEGAGTPALCELLGLEAGEERLVDELTEVNQVLKSACQGAGRISDILDDMRLFSHVRGDETRPVSLTHALEVAVRMTRSQTKTRANVRTEFEDIPLVEADEPRLSQVFVNLLLNAAQAIEEGDVDDNEIFVHAFYEDGLVIVEIADSGKGIDDAIRDQIFDPFFTTKPVGEGSGLGLSLSRGMIEEYGGQISFESTPGVGSVFRVALPPAHPDYQN
ncbi:MAG: PAS domain S-box protein [Bradymonadaceae bacterium]|nr:PAS domain S-box protein [Lujinxingiaceae bacterium]